jgi:4-hydroxy-3-polyprenylbenzoate decarboxylase
MQATPRRIVIGISGASGAPYALRLIRLLAERDIECHVAVSTLGKRLLFDESDISRITPETLVDESLAQWIHLHNDNDLGAEIASGSFLHQGMVVVPCSSNTLGAIAAGLTNNLVQRAASVTLKEGRKLILAHRESPLSRIDVLNMERLTSAGAVIAPLAPGFYLRPESLQDIIDFMAGKLLDLLDVEHDLATRWDPSNTTGS